MKRRTSKPISSARVLRRQLKQQQEMQDALSISLAQAHGRLAALQQWAGQQNAVQEQLVQNWLQAQERINLLTDNYNSLVLATKQEVTWLN